MSNKVIVKCPVCNNKLHVEKLVCNNCSTKIEGDFELSIFDSLSEDKQDFILIFLKNEGNIKAIEKELNISYPTVKRMLEDVLNELHLTPTANMNEEIQSKLSKEDILKELKKGNIDFPTANKLMENIRKDKQYD